MATTSDVSLKSKQRRNRVTGSEILVRSGHGSVCQTRCMTRFWV